MDIEQKRIVFTFDDMVTSLRKAINTFPDKRTGKNTQYEMMDASAGAFSVFFTQCPSFLQHQKLMQQKHGLSNAKTLFGMQDIPSDNHIRNLLDQVKPTLLSSVFADCFNALKKSGDLDTYRVSLGKNSNDLLVALDGTTHFSSSSISCKKCLRKTTDGKTLFTHSMVTPTIVKPEVNKVISLTPEFILPQDGDTKQDCELKAAKRWINQYAERISAKEVTILGDDLYAHEPFCRDLLKKGFNFILVCKPESHKTVYGWIKGITKEKIEDRFDGRKHLIYTYRYVEGIPLKDTMKINEDSLLVNFIEVTVKERATGKQVYHNAFVTNHPLTEETIPVIVDCGRARWKIENENNNTLKRQGYNLEHNFGHGKKYLSSILAAMNLISFLFHTMLEFMNKKYQLLKKMAGSRKTLFNDLRAMLKHLCFQSFDSLLQFMIESLQRPIMPETLRIPI